MARQIYCSIFVLSSATPKLQTKHRHTRKQQSHLQAETRDYHHSHMKTTALTCRHKIHLDKMPLSFGEFGFYSTKVFHSVLLTFGSRFLCNYLILCFSGHTDGNTAAALRLSSDCMGLHLKEIWYEWVRGRLDSTSGPPHFQGSIET